MADLGGRRRFPIDRRSCLSLLARGFSLGLLPGTTLAIAPQVVGPPDPSPSSTSAPPQIIPASLLAVQGTITPAEQFFVRSHHKVPNLNLAAWKLRVEGKVNRPLEFTFADLLEAPGKRSEAVLECAGNGAEGSLVSSGLWEGV